MSPTTMSIPNEILLSILAMLDKTDLKMSRLVSRSWCACATQFLFQEIYVSSAKDDLEVFEAVAHNPLLSSCVRILKYDATEFLHPLSGRGYFRRLYHDHVILRPRDEAGAFKDSSDPDVPDWFINLGNLDEKEGLLRFQDSHFMQKGFREYTAQADYQHNGLKSGQFLARLTSGLESLRCLTSVTLEGSWPCRWDTDREQCGGKGSYLARHWPRFQLRPQGWQWSAHFERYGQDYLDGCQFPDGEKSYRIITSALTEANCNVTSFEIGTQCRLSPGLPPPVFETAKSNTGKAALSRLKRFVLRLKSFLEEPDEGPSTAYLFDDIGGVPALLCSMSQLNFLELRLPNDFHEAPMFYMLHEVLPRDTKLTTLECLVLENVYTTSRRLLSVIYSQTPSLMHLGVGSVDFWEGSWEGFFEALTALGRLSSLQFEPNTWLFHGDGALFGEDHGLSTLYQDIEHYVIHGGRHPCLVDGLPNSASLEYLTEFPPKMRQRLVQMRKLDQTSENVVVDT